MVASLMERFNGTAEDAEKKSTEDAGARGLVGVKIAVEQKAELLARARAWAWGVP